MDRARASDSPEVCPLVKSGHSPSRHKGRPKLLNLPPEAKHPADTQRSFKTKTRTLEERPKWPQEEVRFWLALGKRREGARAKVSCGPWAQLPPQHVGSSQPWDGTSVLCIARLILTTGPPGKPPLPPTHTLSLN